MNITKSQSIRASVIGLLVLVTAMTAGAGPAPIDNLSRYFAGMYRGVTPGNNLTLQITPVTLSMTNPYDYFVSVSGQFEKTNIREQAVLRIETQGDSIHIGYIPHFDAAVSSISPSVGRFSPDELNAACSLYLKVQGDGFGGETRPSDCARAIRGTAGRSWRVEIEPNRVTLKDAKTGETLRFENEDKAR